MASSTLDRTGEKPPIVNKGHGVDALGPSDGSDSGSDVRGGPGLSHDVESYEPRTGNTSEPERADRRETAGPDIGDANMDSDSDAGGTGERAAAGRDTKYKPGQDIDTDRIETLEELARDPDAPQGRPRRRERP